MLSQINTRWKRLFPVYCALLLIHTCLDPRNTLERWGQRTEKVQTPYVVPVTTTVNGTYAGRYNNYYSQDHFLGIPYAQSPIGDLRFRRARSLRDSWEGIRHATSYGPQCVGYGVRTVRIRRGS